MKLNVGKIRGELNRIGKNKTWLANQIGTSRQLVCYWLKTQSLVGIDRIAKALGMSPRDLIK